MKKIAGITLLVLLLVFNSALSQPIDKFTYLTCSGAVPADFTTLSTVKFEKDHGDNKDKALDKNFFLTTRFLFDRLLLSGQVLFNEPVSDYVSDVANYVLRDEKELLSELRFYVLRTNTPNAFSTDQGIILVTTGLLAQLSNEAQLAFILAHEISHFTEKHVRSEYVENQKITKKYGGFSGDNYYAKASKISEYSKDQELEADKLGLEIYQDSEYDIEEVYKGFEVLYYSYLPFDDIQFATDFFDTDFMQVPASYFPDTIHQIETNLDYSDELHSHPNIQTRIEVAMEYLGSSKTQGTKKYIVSEERFHQVQTLARFEGINLDLSSRNYVNALYSIFLLRRDFPENKFLEVSELKALYGLTKYKNSNRFDEVTISPGDVEGESHKLHAFFNKISKQQLNVISFRYVYDLSVKYPNDSLIAKYLIDLKNELALKSGLDVQQLKSESRQNYYEGEAKTFGLINEEDSITKINDSDLSTYDKIKARKLLKDSMEAWREATNDSGFHLFALADLVADHDLINELETIKRSEIQPATNPKKFSLNLFKIEESQHLGIDKLVVVDPLYDNFKLSEKQDHLKSEKMKVEISQMYMSDKNELDLQVQLVDSKNLTSSDVTEYNNLGIMIRWISEKLDHEDLDMISSGNEAAQMVAAEMNCDNFLFSGIYAYKEHAKTDFLLVNAALVQNFFEMISLCINAKTDQIEFVQMQKVNLKSKSNVVGPYVYDILYQLSSDPKPKKR